MATHHVTVTLGSGATPILTPSAGQSSKNVLEVQIDSDYGASIPAGGGTANRLVIRTGGSRQINLATIYLFGTASQKCHVLYHT